MTSPFLEGAYLLQAFVAAVEALQIQGLLSWGYWGYERRAYFFVYLSPIPLLCPTNISQRPQPGPNPRAPPPLRHLCANQDPKPFPQADPALRTRKERHCYDPLGLVFGLYHRGVAGCLLQHHKHHPLTHLYQVC